jgi:cytochrome P450
MGELWKPLDAEFVSNPYPMYQTLRETVPVYQARTGEWVITKYDDVKETLRSTNFAAGNRLEWLKRGIAYFESKKEDLHAIYDALNSFLVLQNGPRHTLIRSLVSKAWHDKEVEQLIEKNVKELIAKFPKNDFDFIEHFAQPLPVRTISSILGISTKNEKELRKLATSLTESLGLYISFKELVTINQSAKELITFFREQLSQKKDLPDQSLISTILRINHDENIGLFDEELISLYIFLFIAGEETSANLLGSGMFHLLSHPEQMERLKRDHDLIPTAVEELLRFDPSIQIAGRVALQDYKIKDKLIPKGSTVSIVIGSANRDPEHFKNPDALDVSRNPNRHLTFGAGVHYCMGDWLARKQAQLAFKTLLTSFKEINFGSDDPLWNRTLTFRSMKQLPIKVS